METYHNHLYVRSYENSEDGIFRGCVSKLFGNWNLCQRQGIFLLAPSTRPALGPTQPPVQWVTEVKRQGREADRFLPSSGEAKNA
jgi:hypothetical protein